MSTDRSSWPSPSSSPKFGKTSANLQEEGSSSNRQSRYPTPPKESLDYSGRASQNASSPTPAKRDKTTLKVRWDSSVVDNQDKRKIRKHQKELETWMQQYRPGYRRKPQPGDVDENYESLKPYIRKQTDDWIREYRPDYKRPPPPTEEDDFDPADFSPIGSRVYTEANTSASVLATPPILKSILKSSAGAYTPTSPKKRPAPVPNNAEPHQNSQLSNTGLKRTATYPAPAPARFLTKRRSPMKSRIPPAAPDPPLEMSRPPQTPRISRLPTPDLPDIAGEEFCNCGNCKTTTQEKMASKIKAAEAYIKSKRM